ncbi:MAG: hypothetical protein GY771_11005 [bacterium]|nr:hypothetical protein [bacterium]
MTDKSQVKADRKIEDLRGGAGCALVTAIPLGIAGFVFVMLFGLSFIDGFAEQTPFWAIVPFTFAISVAALIVSALLVVLAVKRFEYAKIIVIDNAIAEAAGDNGTFTFHELAHNTPIPIKKLQKRLNELVRDGIVEYEKGEEGELKYKL